MTTAPSDRPPIEHLRESLARLGVIAEALVDAALKNQDVQTYIRDLTPWHGAPELWTVQTVRRNPPVLVEFEHGYGIGGIGETIAACVGKRSFGEFVAVHPIPPDCPVGEIQILMVWKDSNPRQKTFAQRQRMRKRLGKAWGKLVGEAMARPKGRFLAEVAEKVPGAAEAIRRRLGVDPGRFWRAVKGKEFIEIVEPPTTGDIFAGLGAEYEKPARERPKLARRKKQQQPDQGGGLFPVGESDTGPE